MSFVLLLCGLSVLGVLRAGTDAALLGGLVFVRYLEVARALQRAYSLEPAGSHGVWGLDDHQFLCYYWGAAQLADHPHSRPKSITNRDMVDTLAPTYMYFRAIQFVQTVKTGPFHEHSPVLYDISGVPGWAKVCSGLLKMYMAEVLRKFPVVQHLRFGRLLPFEPAEGARIDLN
ncbi:Serine/threonine-protein phosphatase 2A activator [Cladochytrium tenue]|nr:Serine/threonine-protein phosphatase 2A activator [Cladochytrium tenue]